MGPDTNIILPESYIQKFLKLAQKASAAGLKLDLEVACTKLGFDSAAFFADLFDTLHKQICVKRGDQECEAPNVPQQVNNKTIEDGRDKKSRRKPTRRGRRGQRRKLRTELEAHEGNVIHTQSTAANPARRKGDNPSTTFTSHKRGDPSIHKFAGHRGGVDNVKRGSSVLNTRKEESSTSVDNRNGKRGGEFVKRGQYGAGNANWKGKTTAVGGGNGQRGGVHAKRGHGARSANDKGIPTAAANKASSGGRGQRDEVNVRRGQCAESASGEVLPTAMRRSSGDQRNHGDSDKRGQKGAGGAESAKTPISILKRSAAALDQAREKKQVKFSQLYFSRNSSTSTQHSANGARPDLALENENLRLKLKLAEYERSNLKSHQLHERPAAGRAAGEDPHPGVFA